jgi:hypothetical protein
MTPRMMADLPLRDSVAVMYRFLAIAPSLESRFFCPRDREIFGESTKLVGYPIRSFVKKRVQLVNAFFSTKFQPSALFFQ